MTISGKQAKDKGSRAEREVAAIYADLLGLDVRRTLAGHADDIGDLTGVPQTTIQIKNYADPLRAIREGLPELICQQQRAGTPFAALWVRRRGGMWMVVNTPQQHAALWREATS